MKFISSKLAIELSAQRKFDGSLQKIIVPKIIPGEEFNNL
jgi:hypothetical protein